MDAEAVAKLIKYNLTVDLDHPWGESDYVRVKLLWQGELISSESIRITPSQEYY